MATKLTNKWIIRTKVKNGKIIDLRKSPEYDELCKFEESDPQKFSDQYGRKCPPQITQPQAYLFHTSRMYKEALDKVPKCENGVFVCDTEEEARYVWNLVKDWPGAEVDPLSTTDVSVEETQSKLVEAKVGRVK